MGPSSNRISKIPKRPKPSSKDTILPQKRLNECTDSMQPTKKRKLKKEQTLPQQINSTNIEIIDLLSDSSQSIKSCNLTKSKFYQSAASDDDILLNDDFDHIINEDLTVKIKSIPLSVPLCDFYETFTKKYNVSIVHMAASLTVDLQNESFKECKSLTLETKQQRDYLIEMSLTKQLKITHNNTEYPMLCIPFNQSIQTQTNNDNDNEQKHQSEDKPHAQNEDKEQSEESKQSEQQFSAPPPPKQCNLYYQQSTDSQSQQNEQSDIDGVLEMMSDFKACLDLNKFRIFGCDANINMTSNELINPPSKLREGDILLFDDYDDNVNDPWSFCLSVQDPNNDIVCPMMQVIANQTSLMKEDRVSKFVWYQKSDEMMTSYGKYLEKHELLKKDALFVEESVELRFESSKRSKGGMDKFHKMLSERHPVFISIDDEKNDVLAVKIIKMTAFKQYIADIVKIERHKITIGASSNVSVLSSETPITQI